jgi:hypothetical protein
MWAKWRILVEPMHDALIEDAFDRAEHRYRSEPTGRSRWSLWVRLLRRMRGRKAGRKK